MGQQNVEIRKYTFALITRFLFYYSKIKYLFVGQGAEEAKGRMGARCVALHEALDKHKITHEYYVGGYSGHDWATWRHLLYYRFLPNLWR